MKISGSLLLGLSIVASRSVAAEQGCPDGFVPNPTWTQGQPYCIASGAPSGAGYASPQPSPSRYERRWGAISYDAAAGKFGASNAMTSKRGAEKAAVSHCASKGAGSCKIILAYHNQCGAIAVADGNLSVAHAPSDKEAEASAMQGCTEKSDPQRCKIYHSDCSYAERVR